MNCKHPGPWRVVSDGTFNRVYDASNNVVPTLSVSTILETVNSLVAERDDLRARLTQAVGACDAADRQFNCACVVADEDSLHSPDCDVPLLARVRAENAEIERKVNNG